MKIHSQMSETGVPTLAFGRGDIILSDVSF